MSKNDIVINKYNINHRSARRLFRVNSYNKLTLFSLCLAKKMEIAFVSLFYTYILISRCAKLFI